MRKNVLIIFLGFIFLAGSAFAQQKTISGKVTSADDNGPLPGASVKIKGSATGVSTDAEGRYTIKAAKEQTLVYSFVGYTNQEFVVGETSVINVVLGADTKSLNEVVVTAFNIGTTRKDLTTSVPVVKGEDIQQPRGNFLNSLQGRVAGVTVTRSSGQPGASSSIVLRGTNSIGGNNQPLFVVDGVRIDNTTFNQGALVSDLPNRGNDYTNRAADINPTDIESITVLKGPEAAALYGSDAASGAIVITTKKGKPGEGKISYDNNFAFSDIYRYPKIQTVYGPGTNSAQNPLVRTYFGPKYPAGTPLFDNLQNFYKTGFVQQHNLGLDGGSEKITYRLSTSYRNEEGNTPNTYSDRLTMRLTTSAKISDKFSNNTSLNYINTKTGKVFKGAGGSLLTLLTWPSNDDARNFLNADGTRRRLLPAGTTTDGLDLDNPYFMAEKNINVDKTNRLLANTELSYDPVTWFNVKAQVGLDNYSTIGNSLTHPESNLGFSSRGILENFNENSTLINGTLVGTFTKNWKDFRTSLVIGGEALDNRYEVTSIRGTGFYNLDFNSINNTDPTTQRSKLSITQRRRLAGFARFSGSYKDLFNILVTGRNDWSSTLPVANRSYFYPSVGAGFTYTSLPFLKDNKVLTYGKFRASYAEVGKDAPPYNINNNLVSQATTGGGLAYGVFGSNPTLKNESLRSFEIGTEMQFWKGRLGLDVAYYDTRPTDQIVAPRTSYATGFVLQYFNGGTTSNKGVEITLSGQPVKTQNFTWDSQLAFTKTASKVLSLPQGQNEYYNSDTWLYANARASIFPGGNTTTIGGSDYQRNNQGQILVDPTNGLPIRTTGFVPIGDRNPDFTLGFFNRISYKAFDISFLFDIRKGGDVFNGNELFLYVNGLSTRSLNRETPVTYPGVLRDGNENSATPTQNTIQVTPYTNQGYYTSGYIESDFIEKNINWIRLQDVTLNYRFPEKLLQKQKVFRTASVYVTATDLFMITNYSGADPNVNGNSAATLGSGSGGFDYGVLATPRLLSFGLRFGL